MSVIYTLFVLLIVLYVLTKCSSTLKYHVKYISFCLANIIITGIATPFTLLNPGSSKNIYIGQFFVWLSRIDWLFGLDIRYEGLQNLQNVQKPVVIVSNHQTILDPIILYMIVPNNTTVIAKKSILYVPVFGVACWLYGVFFIDRGKHKSAIETMREIAVRMNQQETNVVIFAEGTRSQKNGIQEFKKGAFHLAIEAQVPIIPVVFGDYRNVIDRKNFLFEGGELRVKVLPPVITEGLGLEDINALVDDVRGAMSSTFNEDYEGHRELYKDLPPCKNE